MTVFNTKAIYDVIVLFVVVVVVVDFVHICVFPIASVVNTMAGQYLQI
jgi:hypothetical protein